MTSRAPRHEHRSGQAGLAEAVGTGVLVLVSAGAVCFDHAQGGPLGRLGVALVSGITLGATMLVLRRLSGGYLNPVATLAALVARRLSARMGLTFVLAQLAGAAAAGVVLRVVFPTEVQDIHLGAPVLARGASSLGAAAIEALVAFAWVLVLGATTWRDVRHRIAPWVVGLIYGGGVLVAGPLAGAAGNPARAFGPAFASGAYADQEVYWLGPAVGAAGATALVAGVRRRKRGPAPAPSAPEAGDAHAHYRQGAMLYRDRRLAEAAHEFGLATEMSPRWPEPYYYIGIIYRELGDPKSAQSFFDAALYLRWQQRTPDA